MSVFLTNLEVRNFQIVSFRFQKRINRVIKSSRTKILLLPPYISTMSGGIRAVSMSYKKLSLKIHNFLAKLFFGHFSSIFAGSLLALVGLMFWISLLLRTEVKYWNINRDRWFVNRGLQHWGLPPPLAHVLLLQNFVYSGAAHHLHFNNLFCISPLHKGVFLLLR